VSPSHPLQKLKKVRDFQAINEELEAMTTELVSVYRVLAALNLPSLQASFISYS